MRAPSNDEDAGEEAPRRLQPVPREGRGPRSAERKERSGREPQPGPRLYGGPDVPQFQFLKQQLEGNEVAKQPTPTPAKPGSQQ